MIMMMPIGIFLSINNSLLVDLCGVENIARTQALLSFAVGLSMLLGIPFSGELTFLDCARLVLFVFSSGLNKHL